VTIVDRVTLPRVEAPAWRTRLHAEYRPRAEARGYALVSIRETGAAFPRAVEVVVEWALPDVRSFWRARASSHDPATLAWWAATDAVALARTRSVLATVPPVTP
jgi:hypothetical protein